MRKAQKKQAEDFIVLMKRGHQEIKAAMGKKNYSIAFRLLADCQEGALALGNMIEEEAYECGDILSELEKYCDLLYQLYKWLEQKESGKNPAEDGKEIYKSLNYCFCKFENNLKNKIKTQLEILFLPYKASMWDCFESIWKAASEDFDCNVYVIPIPYYDKDANGSMCEMHYEGGMFPTYVPVTWYREYDFMKRHPDVVFIHNPYDDCNYVTSVSPFFYSQNLKKFTEKLIYIPYFMLGDINPYNRQEVEGVKHFCILPGVINADRVIVQSEDMRKVYIQVLLEEFKGSKRNYWEKKILGIGSPKADKVLDTQKENLEIPDEWIRLIQKSNGKRKKIIFYNTSITALLNANEKMFVKMEKVFHVFQENKEDVVLIWRPHPLIEATIESMRPAFCREYRKLVDRFKCEEWGIYDDSADMNRVICLSDAYYGDWSSLAWLYKKTGKPVMIQNVFIMPDEEKILHCADMVKYHNSIFVLSRDLQCLYEYSEASGKIKVCGLVKNRPSQTFAAMDLCDDKLYIAPFDADVICIYHIIEDRFEWVPVGKAKSHLRRERYHICRTYGKKVYFFGEPGTVILCVDTTNNVIEEVSEWQYEFRAKYGHECYMTAYGNLCIVDDCVWLGLSESNMLLQYNMLTNQYKFWRVGKRKIQYVTVTYDGADFWLSGDMKFIVRWNKETDEVREYSNFPNGFESDDKETERKELFSCGYLWKGAIYFAPLNANMVVEFSLQSEEMKCILKTKLDSVCTKILEISEEKIYVEEDDANMKYINSYYINRDGSYRIAAIKLGEGDTRHLIYKNIDMIEEVHPQYLYDLISFVKKNNIGGPKDSQNKNVGEIIMENIKALVNNCVL